MIHRTKANPRSVSLIVITAIATLSMLIASISPAINQIAFAADESPDILLEKQIKSDLYAEVISSCFRHAEPSRTVYLGAFVNPFNDYITSQNAQDGKWFGDGLMINDKSTENTEGLDSLYPQAYLVGTNGINKGSKFACRDASTLIKSAASLWGVSTLTILCNSNIKRSDSDDSKYCTDASNPATEYQYIGSWSDTAKAFDNYAKSQGFSSDLSKAALYYEYHKGLANTCIPAIGNSPSDLVYNNDSNGKTGINNVTVAVYNSESKKWEKSTGSYPMTKVDGYNCKDMVNAMKGSGDSNVNAYIDLMNQWNKDHPEESITTTPIEDEGEIGSTTTCAIPSIGWIVCPVMKVASYAVDAAYSIVSSLLESPPLSTNVTDSSNGMYTAWAAMRNIANVAFVIAFMIVIFSQLTSVGISNYGIKTMLPKIIIAAILVNISYFLCAIAIDISNIIGSSIRDTIINLSPGTDQGGTGAFSQTSWVTITSLVLGGGAAAGVGAAVAGTVATAGIWVWWSILAPALTSAAFAILITLLVLLARHVLIILLVVISPLAFVMYFLPNTKEWYDKWKSLFLTLLIMYPIVGLIFGASELASVVITTSKLYSDWDGTTVRIIGAFVSIIPLVLTPFVIKTAGGLLSKIGLIANDKSKGLFDNMRNNAAKRQTQLESNMKNRAINSTGFRSSLMRRNLRTSARNEAVAANDEREFSRGRADYLSDLMNEGREGQSPLSRTGGRFQRGMATGGGDAYTRSLARAVAAKNSLEKEDIEAGKALISTAELGELDRIAREGGLRGKAAIHIAGQQGNDKVFRSLMENIPANSSVDQNLVKSVLQDNFGNFKDKAPDLVKGGPNAFNSMTGEGLTKLSDGAIKSYMSHLNSLSTTDPGKFKDAAQAFNSAVKDISINPSLQANFNGDIGKIISSSEFNDVVRNSVKDSLSLIQSDGKIRGGNGNSTSIRGNTSGNGSRFDVRR